MLKISKRILTQNPSYVAATPLTPTGIVVHSTGVNQKKLSAYWGQFNNKNVKKSIHGAIGLDDNDKLTYEQWLPYSYQCWGCGQGFNGSYNKSCLQFEICEYLSDEEWAKETYEAALDLCTQWCIRYRIPVENVVCHSEAYKKGYASNHADVMHWWGKYGLSMDGFRAELQKRVGDDYMTKEQILEALGDQWIKRFDDLPSWAKADMRELLDSQVVNGGTDYKTDPDDINMFLSDIKALILCKRMMKK